VSEPAALDACPERTISSRMLPVVLDSANRRPHTSTMAAPSSVVEVTDPRDNHRRLRVSWHPERRELIVSHWRDNVCVATTPVGVREIAGLIGLLARALQDAAITPPGLPEPGYQATRDPLSRRFLTSIRRRLNELVSAVAKHRGRLHIAEDGNVRRVA